MKDKKEFEDFWIGLGYHPQDIPIIWQWIEQKIKEARLGELNGLLKKNMEFPFITIRNRLGELGE